MGTCLRFLFFSLFTIQTTIALADRERSCASELAGILDRTFDKFTSLESDPDRAKQLQKLLNNSRGKIQERVRKLCPSGTPCPPSTLVHAVTSSVEEEIAELEAPNVKIGWRVWFTVAASAAAYVGTSTAASTYMDSITATMTVAFLTYFGTSVLDAIGAPVLEYVLPPIRRWMYANNNMAWERDLDRNTHQQRHRLIYMLQQELLSQIEIYGRTTDTEVVLRMIGVLNTCSMTGDCQQGKERSAEIIAKLISHVVKQYPEIDLRDSDYAEWVQAMFAKWNIPQKEQSDFIRLVIGRIADHYDLTARNTPSRQSKYMAILKSWFAIDTTEPIPALGDGSGI